jgi:hypothetical protein
VQKNKLSSNGTVAGEGKKLEAQRAEKRSAQKRNNHK